MSKRQVNNILPFNISFTLQTLTREPTNIMKARDHYSNPTTDLILCLVKKKERKMNEIERIHTNEIEICIVFFLDKKYTLLRWIEIQIIYLLFKYLLFNFFPKLHFVSYLFFKIHMFLKNFSIYIIFMLHWEIEFDHPDFYTDFFFKLICMFKFLF